MPVFVQECTLRADGPIYYATREVGRLYETGDHLHNYALTYALGFAQAPYHVESLRPSYAEHLAGVTQRGVYVTPAMPFRVAHTISSLKFGFEKWHEDTDKKKAGNYPNYGRIKEIAPGSLFRFCVLSSAPISLPHWIRLGIWMTKCEVIVNALGYLNESSDVRLMRCEYTLNPLDLPSMPFNFDIVPMPPSSLIRFPQLEGIWLTGALTDAHGQDHKIALPAEMRYLRQEIPA
jgi:CRISPR-associated protein Csc1